MSPEVQAALAWADDKETADQFRLISDLSKRQPASQTVQNILAAEVRRLSEDAKRLDWLDENAASITRDNHRNAHCGTSRMLLWAEGKTARAAIDAAMKGTT